MKPKDLANINEATRKMITDYISKHNITLNAFSKMAGCIKTNCGFTFIRAIQKRVCIRQRWKKSENLSIRINNKATPFRWGFL